MPISFSKIIQVTHQDDFHAIDHMVMKSAFEIHNEIGRLLDEKVYQRTLLHRLTSRGLQCELESEIRITHKEFQKSYFIDLIVDGVLFETKTTAQLKPQHEAQLLNYLLLTNTQHGKLINFRPNSVQSRFVSTTLRSSDRAKFKITAEDSAIAEVLHDLLSDLGTHLAINLYSDALRQLLDSELKEISLRDAKKFIGVQAMPMLTNTEALIVTAIAQAQGIASYKKHLTRFLTIADLKSFNWINFNNRTITQSVLLRK
ncbi:GxxExxY protein [Thalassobacterium sedimentorum]|nr:GxxExxY protein [Coraliomargarita sp. SDUM461004]